MATANRGLTKLQRERWAPWVLALLCAIAFELLQRKGWFVLAPSSKDAYLGALMSLGGVFTGFMATLKTLLFGLNDRVYGRLKDSGYEEDLLRYLSEALWASMTLCVVALMAFHVPLVTWFYAVIGGVFVFSVAAILRISKIATRLLAARM